MENRSIVLGSVCLDDYVRDSLNKSQRAEREVAMKSKISEIRKEGILYAERTPYDLLIKRSNQLPADEKYPQLDPSFLSMKNKIKHHDHTISVPRFSIYRVYKQPEFTITYASSNRTWFGPHKIPLIFRTYLSKAVEIPHDLQEWLGHQTTSLDIKSYFQGIVPVETKRKIKEARKVFGKRKLFFIAETRPESWDVKEITRDPLVVGVLEDKCYLVDKFDTTPLEEYVSKEFVR